MSLQVVVPQAKVDGLSRPDERRAVKIIRLCPEVSLNARRLGSDVKVDVRLLIYICIYTQRYVSDIYIYSTTVYLRYIDR